MTDRVGEQVLRTSDAFRALKTIGTGDRISLGELTAALGDRGFGLLVLIFALPNIIPMIPAYRPCRASSSPSSAFR